MSTEQSGIEVIQGFDILTDDNAVDIRFFVNTIQARDEIKRRYEGLVTYVRQTKTRYLLQGGITNAHWVPLKNSSIPDFAYNSIAEMRLTDVSKIGDSAVDVWLYPTNQIFEWDAFSIAPDNNTTVIKPAMLTDEQAGRFVFKTELAAKNHNHTIEEVTGFEELINEKANWKKQTSDQKITYGLLYDRQVAVDTRGLIAGWAVPSHIYLFGNAGYYEGNIINLLSPRDNQFSHPRWNESGGNNISGLNLLPSGNKIGDEFHNVGFEWLGWTSYEYTEDGIYFEPCLISVNNEGHYYSPYPKNTGGAIRLIKPYTNEADLAPITDADGNIYQVVRMGEYVMMAENLRTTKYANGESIAFALNNSDWTTFHNNEGGVCCTYEFKPLEDTGENGIDNYVDFETIEGDLILPENNKKVPKSVIQGLETDLENINEEIANHTHLLNETQYTNGVQVVDGKAELGGDITKTTILKNTSAPKNLFGTGISGSSSQPLVFPTSDGGYFVWSGSDTQYNGSPITGYFKLNASGRIDTNFTVYPTTGIKRIEQCPDGKILLIGEMTVNGVTKRHFCRLLANGLIDASFNQTLNLGYTVTDVPPLIFQDNSIIAPIIMAGTLTLIKINASGVLDDTFNSNVGEGFNTSSGFLSSNTKLRDGGTLWAGRFPSFDGNTQYHHLVKIKPDGTIDSSFNALGTGIGGTGTYNTVLFTWQASDGKIYVSCENTVNRYNGKPVGSSLFRLNEDGTLDETFSMQSPFTNTVKSIVEREDGILLIMGLVTYQSQNIIYALNPFDGSKDLAFTCVLTGWVRGGFLRDGFLTFSGPFTQCNGVSASKIATINPYTGAIAYAYGDFHISNSPLSYEEDMSAKMTPRSLIDYGTTLKMLDGIKKKYQQLVDGLIEVWEQLELQQQNNSDDLQSIRDQIQSFSDEILSEIENINQLITDFNSQYAPYDHNHENISQIKNDNLTASFEGSRFQITVTNSSRWLLSIDDDLGENEPFVLPTLSLGNHFRIDKEGVFFVKDGIWGSTEEINDCILTTKKQVRELIKSSNLILSGTSSPTPTALEIQTAMDNSGIAPINENDIIPFFFNSTNTGKYYNVLATSTGVWFNQMTYLPY